MTYQECERLFNIINDPVVAEYLLNTHGFELIEHSDIANVMPWSETPQGFHYWHAIYKQMHGHEL